MREARPAKVEILEQEEGEPAGLLEAWSRRPRGPRDRRGQLGRSARHPAPLRDRRTAASGRALPALDPRPRGSRAVELARELNRLPGRLAVYGIEGEDFAVGEGLTATVQTAVDQLVAELNAELGGRDLRSRAVSEQPLYPQIVAGYVESESARTPFAGGADRRGGRRGARGAAFRAALARAAPTELAESEKADLIVLGSRIVRRSGRWRRAASPSSF